MTAPELRAEEASLDYRPSAINPWHALRRGDDLRAELDRRKRARKTPTKSSAPAAPALAFEPKGE